MSEVVVAAVLVAIGLVLGSFAGATVWRVRARQLVEDKKAGEKIDKKEYDTLLPLAKRHFKDDRSMCLMCKHPLAWYDLIPLASWLSTGGKCRYCHKAIGWFEPLMEVSLAAFFVLSFLFWPFSLETLPEISHFVLWLIAGVLLAMLVAYDAKWFLLPDVFVFPLIICSLGIAATQVANTTDILSILGAVVVLSGLYYAIWLISKGEWIGFGDIKLGLALAFLLASWELAVVALFSANIIGLLIVVPLMLLGRMTRKTRLPFGPLLVAGMLVAFFAGQPIIDWYLQLSF